MLRTNLKNKDNKQVLYLVTDSSTANIFGASQINKLKNDGYHISLITSIGKLDKLIQVNVENVYQIPNLVRNLSLYNDFRALQRIICITYRIRPSIIIYSTPKASFLGAIASYILRVPNRIYQIWGARWQSKRGLMRLILIITDLITIRFSCSSLAVSKSLAKLYSSITTMHIDVLDHASAKGVDKEIFFFNNKMPKNQFRDFNIGYLGRVANDKGIKELIELVSRIEKKIPRVKLDIIGQLDTSDLIPIELQKQIRNRASINWYDSLDAMDIPNFVRNWDLQIFLSKREGLGNSVIEVGACGVPTIGWDIIGLKDAVPNKLRHFLIPEGNMDLLESRVETYFTKPLTIIEREELSNWTFENFNSEIVLTDFVNYVKSKEKI